MATTITERLGAPVSGPSALTDLAAIEALNGTGIAERTGQNAWSLRSISGAGSALSPEVADGLSLGTASLPWSDLFLATGGVVNWNNGDVTLTHAANALTLAGASAGYVFDAAIKPSANDGAPLGAAAAAFSDLFLASGAVVNWANGDVTLTHSANALTWAGATAYTFDVAPNVGGSAVQTASDIATQADQETGTSTQKLVTSGRQHFEPGHPKCWAMITVAGGTPTLQSSYNITGIADTTEGQVTITIATDFSSANWCCLPGVEMTQAGGTTGFFHFAAVDNGSQAAGSVRLECAGIDLNSGSEDEADLADPEAWHMVGLGDQA